MTCEVLWRGHEFSQSLDSYIKYIQVASLLFQLLMGPWMIATITSAHIYRCCFNY